MHKKITTGFVIQTYEKINGQYVCIDQQFVAGDQVDYEDSDGGHLVDGFDIDSDQEVYQPFDMKDPSMTCSERGLIFTCPSCQGHRLECCEDGPYNSEVMNIDEEGDFDFGEINASGTVDRFQCLECGFVLDLDENGSAITDNEEVALWILENCEQPKEYMTTAELLKKKLEE